MTMRDYDILQRCHDEAVDEAVSAATAIAELVCSGIRVDKADVERYKAAKLGVESTRRDLEMCLDMELAKINS